MAKDLCEKGVTYHLLEPIQAAFERFFVWENHQREQNRGNCFSGLVL